MRKGVFVPMILLLACLLAGCKQTETAEGVRGRYRQMTGCTMEAAVACAGGEDPWRGTLRCHYVPEGESVIEVLEPEAIAGVEAVLEEGRWSLRFAGKRLDAGAVSREKISPAACLPRLMNALREDMPPYYVFTRVEAFREDMTPFR